MLVSCDGHERKREVVVLSVVSLKLLSYGRDPQ